MAAFKGLLPDNYGIEKLFCKEYKIPEIIIHLEYELNNGKINFWDITKKYFEYVEENRNRTNEEWDEWLRRHFYFLYKARPHLQMLNEQKRIFDKWQNGAITEDEHKIMLHLSEIDELAKNKFENEKENYENNIPLEKINGKTVLQILEDGFTTDDWEKYFGPVIIPEDPNKPKVHNLKTIQPYFNDVLEGKKKFEVRKNDRDFKVGDVLILEEYDNKTNIYSNSKIYKKITYMLPGGQYGIDDDFVVLGIEEY